MGSPSLKGRGHSRRKQMTDQRVLVLTQIFSPKKIVFFFHFFGVKKIFEIFLKKSIMQLFNTNAVVFSPEKVKKTGLKGWLIIGPFFSTVQPSPKPRIDFPYYKYVPRSICFPICGRGHGKNYCFYLFTFFRSCHS